MDRKTAVSTGWILVGGTLLLGGCMTPGVMNQDPPGFQATFHSYDRHFRSLDGIGPQHLVVPVEFDFSQLNLSAEDLQHASHQVEPEGSSITSADYVLHTN